MSEKPILTPHQRAALSGAHHLCVTANAGSGKTLVLVERYFHLVAQGLASVKEIVALTFTEKAASELRRKIAERVDEALQDPAGGPRPRRLEDFRSALPSATIGTIHSFCAMLLREFPVEADVDAAFGIIEGLDQRTLLEESVRDTFHDLLRGEAEDPLRARVAELVRSLGKRRVVAIVSALVEKREEFSRWSSEGGLYRLPDTELLARWDREVERFVDAELAHPPLLADVELVRACGSGGRAEAARALDLRSPGAVQEKARAFRQFLETAVTRGGTVQKSYARSATASEEAAAGRLARWRGELYPLLAHLADGSPAQNHERLLGALRVLSSVAERAIALYDRRKEGTGQLDFADLEIRARALLANEAVRSQLEARFKFIMVDEYQDTNQLQYDILLPLLRQLAAGNLFIVGDPKQSIYGFRGADVTVFSRTREDLLRVVGGASDVILDESFRPLRDIAAFVNLVFGHIMGGPVEDLRYDPLVRARQNTSSGRVELLLGEENGSSEADRIARRILQLIEERHTVYDRSEQPRGVRFRDIAVLLRSRILMPEIEEAFLRYRIPYVVSAGVGYFQTQDILDFYNYCMVLLDPSDDASLAGILRSPFFGISDAELFERSLERRGASLWEALLASRGRTARSSLDDALESLGEDLAVAQTIAVPELIARIVRRRFYVSKLSGSDRGPQALANLEKLQRLARAFDTLGFSNLYDFVGRLRRLITEEEREGQGAIESEGDTVQIMTIHAAKGLEFPVVILPRIHRSFLYGREPHFDGGAGVVFSTAEEGQTLEEPVLALVRERNRRKVLAEEKRIFYVGSTRARDTLILSGTDDGRRGGPSVIGWIAESLDADLHAREVTVPVRTRTLEFASGTFTPGVTEHELVIHVLRDADIAVPRALESVTDAKTPVPPVLLGPIASPPKPEIFSATKVRTYLQCPMKYYLRYVLGFPEGSIIPAREDDEIWEQSHGGELSGRVFHAVMEEPPRDPAEILQKTVTLLRREKLLEGGEPDGEANRIAALVTRVLDAPFWSVVAGGSEEKTEYTMTCPLAGDYIMGTVDRVFRDADGTWHVLDYKTDVIGPAGLEERSRDYLPQIDFYCLLTAKFFGVGEVRGTLLFAELPEHPVQRAYSGADLIRLERNISSTIASIKQGDFSPRAGSCDLCPFKAGVCEFWVKTNRPAQ